MDKLEYKIKIEQIHKLIDEESFIEAAKIAEDINWKKVKSVATLCMIGEVFEKSKRYEESKELFLLAYDRSPIGRVTIYHLTELAIKMGNLKEAQEYYEEFLEVAPRDAMKFVLNYKLMKANDATIGELICILEALKEYEYAEKWAFELANCYHNGGFITECIEECDEIILWFGEGKYVRKAMELKMIHTPLSALQNEKYLTIKNGDMQKNSRQGEKEIGIKEKPVEVMPAKLLVEDEVDKAIAKQVAAAETHKYDTKKFDTVNLQAELAKSMQQIMQASERESVTDTMQNIKRMVVESQIPELQQLEEQEILESDFFIEEKQEDEIKNTTQNTIENETQTETDFLNETEEDEGYAAEREDGFLRINFRDILTEEKDGQIRLYVPKDPVVEKQITGQMSIGDILAEWEKTKKVAKEALEMEKQKRLEIVKAKALQEAEGIMDRLADVIPQVTLDQQAKQAIREEPFKEEPFKEETAMEEPFIEEPFMEEPTIEEPTIEEPFKEKPAMEEPCKEKSVIEEPVVEELKAQQQAIAKSIVENKVENKVDRAMEAIVHEVAKECTIDNEKQSITPIRFLNAEQKEIFSYFVPVSGMEKQICTILEGVQKREKDDLSSSGGNIIIEGGRGTGKTVLATSLVKVLQKGILQNNGKVGTIEASVLNQKDIERVVKKIAGGYLIIEQAGNLSTESVQKLAHIMEQDTQNLLVIMEDDKAGILKVLGRSERLACKFTHKISIPIFTNDELVTFGKAYANELEYAIDDMGILALYNRIGSIEKLDKATTLTEIKEIIDEAIRRAEKGIFKKLFNVMLARRYNESDYIILREKDFE